MNKKLIRVGVIFFILYVFLMVISGIADIYLGYKFHQIYNIISLIGVLLIFVILIIIVIYFFFIAIKSIKQDTISEIEDYDLIQNIDKQDLNKECEKKAEKIQYECPKCSSNSVNTHRFPPFFIKEYTCNDCEHYWSSKDIEKKEIKPYITPYVCINCGSCNLKRYGGMGYSDDFVCLDCGYAGPPLIPDV